MCRTAYWLAGILFAVGLLGVAVAKARDDGFFFLGFVGVYALAVAVCIPLCLVLSILSLVRRESASTAALVLLAVLLFLLVCVAHPIYRIVTEPMRLFQ